MQRRIIKVSMAVVLVLLSTFMINACRSKSHTSSAPAAVYVTNDTLNSSGTGTDDPISGGTSTVTSGGTGTVYSGGTFTITNFTLEDIDGRAVAEMLNLPVQLDLNNVANTLFFESVGDAPYGDYNRIRIQFSKHVNLVSGDVISACTVTPYKANGSDTTPDVVHCDDSTEICWIELNGAIQILADQTNKIGLDFDLKNFIVNDFGTEDCTVTMKISPLNAAGIAHRENQGDQETVTGSVSGLTSTSFNLTSGNKTFTVLTDDTSTLANGSKVRVTSSGIDFSTDSITATSVSIQN